MALQIDPVGGAAEVVELRVSSLELFFDLGFVFTVTQLTSLLKGNVSIEAVIQVVLIFFVLFWMYGGYAWLTNQVPPTSTLPRLLLIAGMAAFLVCALSLPRAFLGSGVEFGISYLLVVLIHGAMYFGAYGRPALRFVPPNLVGALILIGAGFVGRPAAYALWLVPLGLQYIASALTRRADV